MIKVIIFISLLALSFLLLSGCKNNASTGNETGGITPTNTLEITDTITNVYSGAGIGFTVYSNGVAECWKEGVSQAFLVKWDNSFIAYYNLKEW